MKKKLFTLLLAVAASVGTMFASDIQVDGIWYDFDSSSKTATVTYRGSYSSAYSNEYAGVVTIPASVTYSGTTYSVTSIGEWAFAECSSLTSVTIANSVTSIGGHAFFRCSGLTSVTIPNSVTSIGSNAFDGCSGLTSPVYNAHMFAYMPTSYSGTYTIPDGIESIAVGAFAYCTGLTSVTIPNSVTSIGDGAFEGCTGLTSVTIPNSVTSIGNYAFAVCTGLTSINVVDDNPNYSSKDGVLFDKQQTTLIHYPGGKQGAYVIPNSVTSIGDYAFAVCTGLTSITIPNSVTSIEYSAFYGCSGLTSVTIGNSVTSIGDYAFYGCSSLTSVAIPNSVTSIGNYAFSECTGLTSVTIGNNVTSIGDYAFSECKFTSIEIPNSVTSIGDAAFHNCFSLKAIYVPCGELERFMQLLGDFYRSRIKYPPYPYPYSITTNAQNGYISVTSFEDYKICDEPPFVTCSPIPDYGYHFLQWSDGNTDNPRTIELTQDTTLEAEFAKNSYIISTISANLELGTTIGDTTALYLDEVEISAIPNYGYRFVHWDDNNTSNPRMVTVTEDKTYTATFSKDIFSITKNAEHGSISGNSSSEYLDFVTLTAVPNYGYHFTQWSDGLKDNPRIFQITKDTAFTAEFAYDRVGTCGKDLALVWSYDPANKVLTIGNAGSFTENMQYGAEAPNEMEELVIGNSVTAIGANAFAGISSLKKVSIGESVKTIGEQAFYNCMNLETIFNYRPTPTNTYSNAFDGVDKFECTLYVLPSSIDMYKAAAVWRDFYYTYAIGAEETTIATNDVQVEPQDNAATLTWPTNNNAASYTIQITKDGVLFCTLTFNANGQLTGIAFAPGREGVYHAPAAVMTANGLQFTVTGLDSNTQYGYNLTAKDSNDQTVATYSGEFTTTSEGIATGVEEISSSLQGGDRGRLILYDGQIFILRGEKVYTIDGRKVR